VIHDIVVCPYLMVGACAVLSLGAGSLLGFIFRGRRLIAGRYLGVQSRLMDVAHIIHSYGDFVVNFL